MLFFWRGGGPAPHHFLEQRKDLRFHERTINATVVFEGVLGLLTPCIARPARRCPGISVVPEAMHQASQGPSYAVSAQKALQGSERETWNLLGETEEKSITLTRDH